jgi:hypothetical protein
MSCVSLSRITIVEAVELHGAGQVDSDRRFPAATLRVLHGDHKRVGIGPVHRRRQVGR